MAAHSKSFVVFLVLAGSQPSLVTGIRRALSMGVHVTVVTDRRTLPTVTAELKTAQLPVSDLRLIGIRARPLEGLKQGLRDFTWRFPRAFIRGLHRGLVGVLRRLSAPAAVLAAVGRRGRRLEQAVGARSEQFSLTVLEPVTAALGDGLTRARQCREVLRIVSDHIRAGRLLGVVCLDSPSLLPGWVVGRRYEVLPVVTAFPIDWDTTVVEQLSALEAGSRW